MNTEMGKKNNGDFEFCTIRKDIRNIHLGVYPPDGRVRVAAPTGTTDETIKVLIASKTPWIKKQQSRFEKQERQAKREFVSGESHFFMGDRYLLSVIYDNSASKVEIKGKSRIDLHARAGAPIKKRERLMDDFYRLELKRRIPVLISKWEKTTGIKVSEFRIRKMKTKWGTCSQKYKRVWINLELAKKPPHCLEYVVVHEMVHLVHRTHNKEFTRLMNTFMPQWAQYKEELNKRPLGYSRWMHLTEQ
jgi:hypothetical protein